MNLESRVTRPGPAVTRSIVLAGIVALGLIVWLVNDGTGASSHALLGSAIVLFALAAMSPLVVGAVRRRLDPFDGRNAFVLFFTLYTLPYPLLAYLRQVPPLLPRFDDAMVLQAMLLSLLGLVSFYGGYEMGRGSRIVSGIALLPSGSPPRALRSALASLLISAVLFGFFIVEVGGLDAYLRAGYQGLYQLERGREHVAIGLPLLGTSLLLLYHAAYVTRSRLLGVLTWILIFAVGALLVGIGRRRYLLTLILAIVVYRQYRKRRLSVAELLVLGATGFLLFNVWGLLRGFPWDRLISPQAWDALVQRPLRDLIYTVAGEGEFSGAGVWMPQVLTQLSDGTLGYRFGLSYLQAPLAFIPRFLYPGRPMMLSEWYVTTYHPDLAAQGGGMGFFFLAEAYLNFGVLGVVAATALAGLVFRIATDYLKKSNYSSPAVLLYAGIISWIPSGMRIDFATAFKGFWEFFFAVLLLAILYSSGWSLRRSRRTGSGGSSDSSVAQALDPRQG